VNTFLEGVEAIRLPCTLALLFPALAVTVASGARRGWALVGFGVGASAVIWARFADMWFGEPSGFVLVIMGAALAGVALAFHRLTVAQAAWVAPLGALAGGVTGWLWRPCVGESLGSIINRAPDDRIGTVVPTAVYVLGVLLVAVAWVVLPAAAPRARQMVDHWITRVVGVGFVVAIGATIAVGWYEDLVAELVRHSTI
jgi:cytochrome c biogenesis protein CcdA